jgi:hypothetical protein
MADDVIRDGSFELAHWDDATGTALTKEVQFTTDEGELDIWLQSCSEDGGARMVTESAVHLRLMRDGRVRLRLAVRTPEEAAMEGCWGPGPDSRYVIDQAIFPAAEFWKSNPVPRAGPASTCSRGCRGRP